MMTPTFRLMNRLIASRRRRSHGFSMVEFMVAVVIGLMVVGVITTAYVQLSKSGTELGRANEQIENGRVAIQIIDNDLVHAGYWGGFVPTYDDLSLSTVPTDVPTAVPDPCLPYSTANWNAAYQTNLLGIPVQVYDNQSILTATSCGSVATDIQPNTDVLVVRHAETCVAYPDPPPSMPLGENVDLCPDSKKMAVGNLYFQDGYCILDPTPSYVITDCP